MYEIIAAAGMPVKGYKRLVSGIVRDAFIAGLTDNQIRGLLYYALQCSDITQEEREEIETLLDLR